MIQQETIKILKYLKQQRPRFFQKLTREEHLALVEEWNSALTDKTYEEVFEALNIFLKQSNSTPYPRHIIEILSTYQEQIQIKTNPWYKHFPRIGDFYYSDKDVKWADFFDWRKLPKEVAQRMHYRPDPNDEERNAALAEALRLREEIFA